MTTTSIPQEVEQLKNDLIWCRHFYNQYQKLFSMGAKRIELLNEIAPSFFRDIQRLLWDELIVSVSKLTDPYRQGKNKNLSLGILIQLAEEYKWEFGKELIATVDAAHEAASIIREWRRKKVAHRDLKTALSKGAQLENLDMPQIDKVLSLAGDAINLVYFHLTDSSWYWNKISPQDADALVYSLKMAATYKEIKSKDILKFAEEWKNSKFRDA